MKNRLLLWYNITVIISMFLNPLELYADENVLLENDEVSQTLEYQVSEVETVNTEYGGSVDTTTYTETETLVVTDTAVTTLEDFEPNTMDEVTSNLEVESSVDTTVTDMETLPTTYGTTMQDVPRFEKDSHIQDGVVIVTDVTSSSTDTNLTTPSVDDSMSATTTVSYLNVNNDATVHTLANTSRYNDTDNSPSTKQITFLIPILLLMAGALFMGATSTPKKR